VCAQPSVRGLNTVLASTVTWVTVPPSLHRGHRGTVGICKLPPIERDGGRMVQRPQPTLQTSGDARVKRRQTLVLARTATPSRLCRDNRCHSSPLIRRASIRLDAVSTWATSSSVQAGSVRNCWMNPAKQANGWGCVWQCSTQSWIASWITSGGSGIHNGGQAVWA
jgi:hypothetical protein